MARPHKAGIDYFPLDTNFDDRVELLKLEFGSRAVGVLVSLYQKIYSSGYYTPWNDDILLLFARSACELEIIEALGGLDLLVIDDLGAEKRTEWSEQTIYTIIDERYSTHRATLVTTNLNLEALEHKIGTRTMDRIIGSCRIVENCASSYRQEKAG